MIDLFQILLLLIIIAILIKKSNQTTKTKTIRLEHSFLLDTSSIIDGRFYELAKLGLITGKVKVLKQVADELQFLYDSPNNYRRSRGKFGQENLNAIKNDYSNFEIIEYKTETKQTDDILIEYAHFANDYIVTTDAGLAQKALTLDVKVINPNDISLALKPTLLIGTYIELKLIKKGELKGQAIGHSEDGTLVVVEDGIKYLGQKRKVEITRYLQSNNGKMAFGKVIKN